MVRRAVEDARRDGVVLEAPANLGAEQIRKLHVEDGEVGLLLPREAERVDPVVGLDVAPAHGAHDARDEVARALDVVDDEEERALVLGILTHATLRAGAAWD